MDLAALSPGAHVVAAWPSYLLSTFLVLGTVLAIVRKSWGVFGLKPGDRVVLESGVTGTIVAQTAAGWQLRSGSRLITFSRRAVRARLARAAQPRA